MLMADVSNIFFIAVKFVKKVIGLLKLKFLEAIEKDFSTRLMSS